MSIFTVGEPPPSSPSSASSSQLLTLSSSSPDPNHPRPDKILDWKLDKAKAGLDPWRVLYQVQWEPVDCFDGAPQLDAETIALVRAREPDKKLPDEMWEDVIRLNLGLVGGSAGGAKKKGLGGGGGGKKTGGVGKAWAVAAKAMLGEEKGAKGKAGTMIKSVATRKTRTSASTSSSSTKIKPTTSSSKAPKSRATKAPATATAPPRKSNLASAAPSAHSSDVDAEGSDDDDIEFAEDNDSTYEAEADKEKEKSKDETGSPASGPIAEDSDGESRISTRRRAAASSASGKGKGKEKVQDKGKGKRERSSSATFPSGLVVDLSRLPSFKHSTSTSAPPSQQRRGSLTPKHESSKIQVHPSRAALFPAPPVITPASPPAASSPPPPPAKKRRTTQDKKAEEEDKPVPVPARAVVLPPITDFEPAFAARARASDFFNHGLERTKAKEGYILHDLTKILSDLRAVQDELPAVLRKALSKQDAVTTTAAFRTAWSIGHSSFSPSFDSKVSNKDCWVYAPRKDATLKQLANVGPGGGFKKKKVQAHYSALQLVLFGIGAREADELRSGTTEVVFVHQAEEGELGQSEGPLKALDEVRRQSRKEMSFYSFGGKLNGFYELFCVHAAVTFTPAAFLEEPDEFGNLLIKASERRVSDVRSIYPWAPAALAAKDGALAIPSTLSHNYFEEPEKLFKSLVDKDVVRLAKPPLSAPGKAPSRPDKAFPAPDDQYPIDATFVHAEDVTVESIGKELAVFRRQYLAIRHWIVIVTEEEKSRVGDIPGIELVLRKDAAAALFV
ncbi:hypothetical protein RQP46_005902 [Phenoliferia psychrophenolica]